MAGDAGRPVPGDERPSATHLSPCPSHSKWDTKRPFCPRQPSRMTWDATARYCSEALAQALTCTQSLTAGSRTKQAQKSVTARVHNDGRWRARNEWTAGTI